MKEMERRKYPRVETNNLVAYCCLDEDGNEISQSMARLLDISPVGIKIETFQKVETEIIRLISLESDGNFVDMRGRVVRSEKIENRRYENGILLLGNEVDNTRFSLKLIAACHREESTFIRLAGADDEEEKANRRKFPRIDTNNLISYSNLDENGNELDLYMARAIDVNSLGARIETFQHVVSEYIQITSVDDEDNLITITGRITYSQKVDDGRYEFGIQFMGTPDENTDFAMKLIDIYQKHKPAFVMVKRA